MMKGKKSRARRMKKLTRRKMSAPDRKVYLAQLTEQNRVAAERLRKVQVFRDAELSRLTQIEDQMQRLLQQMTVLDQAMVHLAANISPMVRDLRRDNASLLVQNPLLPAKNNGRTRHG